MKQQTMRTLCLGLVCLSAALSGKAWSRCADELSPEPTVKSSQGAQRGSVASVDAEAQAIPMAPRAQLQLLASEATRRSNELGAARLLAEASAYDLKETQGSRFPTVTINGAAGAASSEVNGTSVSKGFQSSVSMNVNGSLMDWGRLNKITAYRSSLADMARFNESALKEQVVLEAISTAIERNRYRVQAQVYQQYVRKMSCLVEALQQIVAEDKGRTSELVQARKTQAQAEISRDASIAQERQIEIKLKKLVGDNVKLGEGLTVPLSQVPEIGEINRQVETSSEVQQLRAQAEAMESYAKAVLAGQKPQVNWAFSKSAGVWGSSKTSGLQAGVSVSYTLYNGYSDQAAAMAASKRAEAARQQLAGIVATRTSRTGEVYDQAMSAFDRARRYAEVLRDSDKVRSFTFQQWSQLGKRSLFDVMSSESDHFNLRVAYVNALHDGVVASAQLRSLGAGLAAWLSPQDAQP
jgi:outer membrane protein, adhesin transport system